MARNSRTRATRSTGNNHPGHRASPRIVLTAEQIPQGHKHENHDYHHHAHLRRSSWSAVFGLIPRFSIFGKPADQSRLPRGTYRHPKIIRERSTTLPALSVFADRHGKVQYPLWFHDVPPGWCPEAFARQHVSMADNRQNDTRPIQPSQPPMAPRIPQAYCRQPRSAGS